VVTEPRFDDTSALGRLRSSWLARDIVGVMVRTIIQLREAHLAERHDEYLAGGRVE